MTNASGQFVRPAKNDGSIDYGVSELQHENKYQKDKCLESKQRIRISYEDSICRGNYRTSQGILLLRKHDLGGCHREIKRRIATMASIWFEIWGVVDPGKKISISTGKFLKNFNFFRQFYKRISSFAGKFPKIVIFSGN